MRKFLFSSFLALAFAFPLFPSDAHASEGPAEYVESAMVKVTIKDGDKTIKHPGQECEHMAEYELFMKSGKTKYVVTVLIDKPDGSSKYAVTVSYKRNGKQVVAGDLELASKKPGSLSKGNQKITIMVDPAGKIDGKDKIDGPSGDDPLDGLKKKKKKK